MKEILASGNRNLYSVQVACSSKRGLRT